MDRTEVSPSFREAFAFWVRLGFINFGGPAGQIAIMHREFVVRKRCVPEALFLRALNFATLLPGPEAQQLATYVGCYVTFLPCFFFVFAGAPYIEALGHVAWLQASLTAVTAAVVGVILNLAVFFGVQVLLPSGTLDPFALAAAVLAYLALWRLSGRCICWFRWAPWPVSPGRC